MSNEPIPDNAAPFSRPVTEGRPVARQPLADYNRALPYSDDAEKGVLSCFLQNPVDLLSDAAETIPAEGFYHPVNRQIYEELQTFSNRPDKKALDLVTFSQHLIDKGLIDKMGGPAFFAELLSFVPTAAHYPYYKSILRDKWLLRRVIAAGTEMIQASYEYQENIDELIDKAEMAALAIRPPDPNATSDKFSDALDATFEAIQIQMNHDGELAGISTGLPWLDEMTSGLLPGFYVFAARPAMGKTALALNIFEHITITLGMPCGVFSLEMSKQALIRRIIAAQGWIPLTALMKGKLDKDAQKKFLKAYDDLRRRVSAMIDDRAALSIAQVKNKARRWKKQYGIKAIFLDYLQRMALDSKMRSTRDGHAGNSTGLADLAKELQLPIVVLAQLNRDCETEKRRPRISDIEGCGRIEQDADVIGLLSRHKKQPEHKYNHHIVMEIGKNRDGPTGSETHLFRGPFMRFDADPVPSELLI